MLHQPGRPMVFFSKKLNSFSGEAAQHGRPLQTPLVSLINPHTMLGCLYSVRGVWRQATCQYPTLEPYLYRLKWKYKTCL